MNAEEEIEGENLKGDENIDCSKCIGKKPGFDPIIPRNMQHSFFPKHAKVLYARKEMQSTRIKSVKDILQILASDHKTTIKVAYLTAYRFGIDHDFITNKTVETEKSEDENFFAPEIEENMIKTPDGTWIVTVSDIDEFRGDFRKTGYVKGFMSRLREIVWYLFKYPCAFQINRVKLKDGEIYSTGFCRENECKCSISFKTEENRTFLYVSAKDYDRNIKHKKKQLYVVNSVRILFQSFKKIQRSWLVQNSKKNW